MWTVVHLVDGDGCRLDVDSSDRFMSGSCDLRLGSITEVGFGCDVWCAL